MPINADKPHLWKADTRASVDQFNQWFVLFAPKAYRDTRKGSPRRTRRFQQELRIQSRTGQGSTTLVRASIRRAPDQDLQYPLQNAGWRYFPMAWRKATPNYGRAIPLFNNRCRQIVRCCRRTHCPKRPGKAAACPLRGTAYPQRLQAQCSSTFGSDYRNGTGDIFISAKCPREVFQGRRKSCQNSRRCRDPTTQGQA